MSKKEKANSMKESSELGTTSDLVAVHTLICSLLERNLDGSSQLDKDYNEFHSEAPFVL